MVIPKDLEDSFFAVRDLLNNWTWEKVKKDKVRGQIIRLPNKVLERRLDFPYGGYSFSLRHEKSKGDLRFWTKSMSGLLQWRTCPEKGGRLVYHAFGRGDTERLSIEEIFLDTHNVDEGEVAMFEMLYADLVPLLPMFAEALVKADEYLEKYNGPKTKR